MVSKVMFSSDSCEWETPQDLFESLTKEFNGFDIDIAASASNHKCQVYFTKENSAFDNDWCGHIWCNPPYGKDISKWVEACAKYKGLCVMLLPARTDTKWFHQYIYIINPMLKSDF